MRRAGSHAHAQRRDEQGHILGRCICGLHRSARASQAAGATYSENDFLAQLGERVRTVRLSRDMSRRQLADRSGISERYIAQIEAGKGNVSITLPLRIAHAVRD
jgi:DNA-binding XRE family transcriptional regulator